jgi:signal transduction histidine kinase
MRISTAPRPGGGEVVIEAPRAGAPGGSREPFGALTLTKLALLALTTPLIIWMLAEQPRTDRAVILLVGGLWSVVQLSVLVVILHRDAAREVQPKAWSRDAAALGLRAELAEAAIRREEDRLHELRATVSGIGMTHQLLREHTAELPQPARSRLEGLYETELARLERLVDDADPRRPEVVNVASLVDPLVESLRLRGVRVRWRAEEALATGRPDEVVEIVHNLLENAARHGRGAEVAVTVSAQGDEVSVEVSDDGPGIPAPMRSRLFERGTHRDGSPGRGLGLHIARRLAREMGGDLLLHADQTSGGARFRLTLPSSVEDAACLAAAD